MFSKAKPPPQNFRDLRRQQKAEGFTVEAKVPDEDLSLPPNVYISNVPAEKPGPNWLRMVCISDTHNMTDANNYPIPEADILGKRCHGSVSDYNDRDLYRLLYACLELGLFPDQEGKTCNIDSACWRLYQDGYDGSG